MKMHKLILSYERSFIHFTFIFLLLLVLTTIIIMQVLKLIQTVP